MDVAMLIFRTWRTLFICLIGAVLATGGCATQPASKATEAALFHRSKDFVIYRTGPGDTSASLAERFLGDAKRAWMIDEAKALQPPEREGYAVIPLKDRNRGGIYSNGIQQVPILCYHRFGNHSSSPLVIPADVFERQMKHLKKNGYTVITPEQLLDFLDYRRPLPRKSVMITVDDGYSSFYTVAYPILKKYGFTATLFIYTNFVGVSKKALSWEQLRQLKNEGFTIGSHTIAHSDLSKRDDNEDEASYMERLRSEILKSKKILDTKLDQDTMIFAYPFGRVNHRAMLVTSRSGYRLAVTVQRGGNPFFANRYALQRDQILKRDMSTFVSRLKIFQPLSLR
jgi:peptidoglycan/xylan/chitin deacetylase (PgdA/CDA1 family)